MILTGKVGTFHETIEHVGEVQPDASLKVYECYVDDW